MKRLIGIVGIAAASGALWLGMGATVTRAADHVDAPATVAAPAADINDLYAWMSADASKLNLVMTVSPFAENTAKFSPNVQYVFHVNSSSAFGETQTETKIVCTFAAAGAISCWVGNGEYTTGDASATTGLASASGKFKVYAGLRNDPFFFNLSGFNAVVSTVRAAVQGGSLTFDANGCPDLGSTAQTLALQLQSEPGGGAAVDDFSGANVLALVVEVDKTLVNAGGSTLGVWASTHMSN